MEKLFDRWGINHDLIPAIVTDSAANIKKGIRLLDILNPPCFGHNLQLGITAGMNHPLVIELSSEAKGMVSFFHHSSAATTSLRNLARASGHTVTTLKQSCPTRWGSDLGMYQSLESLKDPVITIMIQSKKKVPDDQFWSDLSEFIKVLLPLEKITTRLSGETYPTMSYVYPILIDLVTYKLAVNDTDSPLVAGFKEEMLSKVNVVFDNDATIETMQLAAVLDPRFKHLGFLKQSAQREVFHLLKDKAEDLDKSDPSTPSPSNSPPEKRTRGNEDGQLDDEDLLIFGSVCLNAMQAQGTKLPKGKSPIDIEIDNYKRKKGCNSLKECPLQWWKKREHQFPTLSRLAKRYLAIPATSVKSERLFSDGGNTITAKRNALLPEFACELILLHANRVGK